MTEAIILVLTTIGIFFIGYVTAANRRPRYLLFVPREWTALPNNIQQWLDSEYVTAKVVPTDSRDLELREFR